MAAAIDLRSDFDGDGLRRVARAGTDARQVRRRQALAAIYEVDEPMVDTLVAALEPVA